MTRWNVAIILLAVTLSQCSHADAARRSCSALRGHDLAPRSGAKLVETGDGRLEGCVRGGRVEKVARTGYELREVRGPAVLVDSGQGTVIFNLRTSHRVAVAKAPARAGAGHVTRAGAAIVAVRTAGAVEIRRFTTSGYWTVLDTGTAAAIPPAGVTLDGTLAGWTHDGKQRTEELAPTGTSCQRLAGVDLAPDPRVRLVERFLGDGHQLAGCVLPSGIVRQVAGAARDRDRTFGYRLRGSAGPFVLLDQTVTSKGDASETTTRVQDLAGGTYDIAVASTDPAVTTVDEVADTAFVAPNGVAVAALTRPGEDVVTIVGYGAAGARTVLDTGTRAQIPPASLRLDGTTATWTHDGAARSVPVA